MIFTIFQIKFFQKKILIILKPPFLYWIGQPELLGMPETIPFYIMKNFLIRIIFFRIWASKWCNNLHCVLTRCKISQHLQAQNGSKIHLIKNKFWVLEFEKGFFSSVVVYFFLQNYLKFLSEFNLQVWHFWCIFNYIQEIFWNK